MLQDSDEPEIVDLSDEDSVEVVLDRDAILAEEIAKIQPMTVENQTVQICVAEPWLKKDKDLKILTHDWPKIFEQESSSGLKLR